MGCYPYCGDNEHRECFAENVGVVLDALKMPGHPVEPPGQGCFEPVVSVRRQMQGERCFYDQRLRHALARGVIGKLDGQIE